MSTIGDEDVYRQLGVQPIINATGHLTVLGGSILSSSVQAAMATANTAFAPMQEVLEKSGAAIAQMLGVEDAYVSSGCFAALVLGVAGIMTGDDPHRIAQLPDTTGMKNEFLIQKQTRYRYDRCVSVAGGKLIEVGDERATTAEQLAEAIGPNTAGILFFARGERIPNTLGLSQVIAVARDAGLPVIVDAAAEVFPLERMTGLATSGADLVCFGGKYIGSANSAGILCGRRERVAAASRNGFIGYETHNNRSIGRGYKVDRQEVIATTWALRQWLTMDHEQRLQSQADRIQTIVQGLAGLPHVHAQNVWEEEGGAWMRLRLSWSAEQMGKTAADVAAALKSGDPSIWTRTEGDALFMAVHTLRAGEEQVLIRRLREELASDDG